MKTTLALVCVVSCLLVLPFVRAEPISLSPAYFAVVRNGDARAIRDALDHGESANARDSHGDTPLMLAAIYGDTACMRVLLDRGALVNVTNADGATPLMRAACDYDKLRLLLDHGADVNPRSARGNSALMLAARPANSHRAVALLLEHGADAKATNNGGGTTLIAAAAGDDVQSAQLLLQYGADPNALPRAGYVSYNGGRTALMWAAYRGDIPMIKTLLAAGADINGEGTYGTPLEQAAWNDCANTCKFLLEHGANPTRVSHFDTYTALHWAASTEQPDDSIVKMLLGHGANPNLGGGDNVDAFLMVDQTPLMLARRRGQTAVVATLLKAGATNETSDNISSVVPPARSLPARLDAKTLHSAMARALPPLQASSIQSKISFVNHHEDCVSCHQQFLPLAAISAARRQHLALDTDAEKQLIDMIQPGDIKNVEIDFQALFHPEPVYTKGYILFGFAAADLPATEFTDGWVHHLAEIQAADGRWYATLPRPPIQSGDIGATALAIRALQRYPLPGRKAEFAKRVDRARNWLRTPKPETTDAKIYQILGLAWSGESHGRIEPLAKALLAEQRADGGWAQLPALKSDAYATGQAIYSLVAGARMSVNDPTIDRARRYLLTTQLADGTWYVHRRAFPFQPTMRSGFPHGRDGWISAAATSWAVMALGLTDTPEVAEAR